MKNKSITRILARLALILILIVCVLGGCSEQSSIRLKKSIGIMTVGDIYSELIPAGQPIPHTFSDSFGNADDNQQAIEITLAQRDQNGIEKICVVVIDDLPPKPAGMLHVVVTAKVDHDKNLKVKATVSESGYIKEFGPFSVE